MLSSHVKFSADTQTERQTDEQAADRRRHKNLLIKQFDIGLPI